MQYKRSLALITLPLAIATTLCVEASINSAEAQIVPDGTLGAESSVVTPDTIKGIPSDKIDGGATRGANLFHSFQDFNVGNGRGAYFNPDSGIENILSRVTGSNASNILGTLGVLGNANLFFINPNGIVFGSNARLDVRGSFFASTADSLVFENGFEFSGSDPQAPPLLTVNIPIGLNFRDNPGEITNRSVVQNSAEEIVVLEVESGNNLTFVGGNINFDGGNLTARGGNIELGGLSTAGTVGISDDGSLNFPEAVEKADISLSNGADVDVSGTGGGSITINAGNLTLEAGEFGSSFIDAGITEDSTSAEAQAGNIIIDVAENITLNDSRIINQVDSGGVGNAGDITINVANAIAVDNGNISSEVEETATGNGGNISLATSSLEISNGGQINAGTSGQGDAGNITIEASDNVSLTDTSLILSNVGSTSRQPSVGVGKVGNIFIEAREVSLTDGAQLQAGIFTGGRGEAAGTISVKALDSISFVGTNSGIFSEVESGVIGNGGDINIEARSLSLENGALISNSTSGVGDAGDISIQTSDTVSFSNSDVFSRVRETARGSGGNINIQAESLSLTDGAQLQADTDGQGDAGSIILNATEGVTFDGTSADGQFPSAAFSSVRESGKGQGGNIEISTPILEVLNGAVLTASTSGLGDAGSIIINATESVTFDDTSAAFSSVGESGKGQGGNIEISTPKLEMLNGAELQADTTGQGDAGNIRVDASDSVILSGVAAFPVLEDGSVGGFSSGLITGTETDAKGQGGEISVTTNRLQISDGAVLSARSTSDFQGGNIEVNANVLEVTAGGQVVTTAFSQGNAGNINLNVSDRISLSGSDPTFFDRFDRVAEAFDESEAIFRIDPVSPESGIFANTLSNSTGSAGNIFIRGATAENSNSLQLPALNLANDGRIAVDSRGQGDGGNVSIQASSLSLDDNADILAGTPQGTGTGGNINLDLQNNLTLREQSSISARATNNADGGNINIDADFIVAFPNQNNDIIANAQRGNGGNINITAQGIFGLEVRPSTPPNQTNDIDASSEFGVGGTVTPNVLLVDPSKRLVELPEDVIDPAVLIAQNPCSLGLDSEFVITGRGGLPPSPSQLLGIDESADGWIEILPTVDNTENETRTEMEASTSQNLSPQAAPENETEIRNPIVPARGWILNEKGEAVLVAYDPTETGVQRFRPPPASCRF